MGQWNYGLSESGRGFMSRTSHVTLVTQTVTTTPRPTVCRWLTALVVLVLAASAGVASAEFRIPRSVASRSTDSLDYAELRRNGICPSMDIRNHVSALSELENCTVVEGFVQILLIEQVNRTDWQNYSFPNLREITGYLLLYRAFGLSTLRDLFPNLTVIRGQTLFYDYALVIYEMFQLREIGLASLTDIQRGSVRIEKNPYLCYVSTVDWDRIAKEGKGGHYIKENMDPRECAPCPSHCPKSVDEQALCWTHEDCQKVCQNCKSCMLSSSNTEICCDDECLGGCTAPNNSSQCTVCQKVMQNGSCRASCIPGSYMFMERRCITDAECTRMPPPREHDEHGDKPHHWKPFKGECVQKCPPKFTEYEVQTPTGTFYTCKQCDGPCPKVCKGILVNNIETAQSLKGCTTIDGVLQIQVKGGNSIVKELEDNLGSIELITGHLKVIRSFPLLSLSFLRSLKEIRGQILDNDVHALVVMNNENLQELWETRNHSISIHNGSVLIHFNPQLCVDKIDRFLKAAMPNKTFSNLEVSPTSNGDQAACNLKELEIRVQSQFAYGIVLEWDDFHMSDRRSLIGYVISFREAPYQNVSYHDGRDACGGDGWKIGDKPRNTVENQTEIHLLTHLKPYTQYAIYVRTVTIAAEGARSKIIYVRTNATHPTSPEAIRAYPNSSSQLFIEWQPPKHPNGVVTHYIVWGEFTKDNEEYFDKSDHCLEHLTISAAKVPKSSIEGSSPRETFTNVTRHPSRNDQSKGSKGNRGECCTCDAGNKAQLLEAREQEFRAKFEDYLHNKVYVRAPESRAKRSTDATAEENELDDFSREDSEEDLGKDVVPPPDEIEDVFVNSHLVKFYRYVHETNITVSKLRHFSEYTIKVWACHDPKPGTKKKLCSSSVAVTSARTRASVAADIISNLSVDSVNETSSSKHVRIHWIDPLEVNGVILRYDIRYQRVEPEGVRSSAVPSAICVRRKDFNTSERVYILKDLLHPGNYSFEVRVVSMKGPGPYTSPVYFTVEEKASGFSGTLTAVVLGILFLVFCTVAAVIFALYWRRKINAGNVIVSLNPDYVSAVYRQDEWEVDRGNVELFRELGQGSFGMVYEGILRNPKEGHEIRCAVKTVNEQASVSERIQFLNEASVMKQFSANHVVKLLGVVSLGQPTLVLMELMAQGDLKTYLRSHRPDYEENISQGRQPPTLRCILKMAIEIADGMAYLADKKFVHRDLAARNCMVADDLTVKIGDFGMTRDIYETDYYRKGGKGLLPVRWMAPESLRDGVFTTQSDIWSYGVVLWEMATLASQPYQGLSNEQVLKYVMDCGVMEKPEGCPDRLYEIMETCWHYQPRHRPTFLDIIHNLLPDVPPQFAELSFYHSEAGVNARESQRSHQEQEQRKLHDPSTPLRFAQDHSPSRSSSRSSRSVDDHFLPLDPVGSREQALAIQEDEANGVSHPLAPREDELLAEAQDHVQVMLAHDRRPYVVVRNPTFATNATNSKSDSSKSTTIPSEDSKGSYVSNGSAGNGYVMGILSRRRQGNTEC